MALTATCTALWTTTTGRWYATFPGLGTLEFQNLQELKDFAHQADDPNYQQQLAAQMLLGWYVAQDPNVTNPDLVVDHKITVDVTGTPTMMFIQDLGS